MNEFFINIYYFCSDKNRGNLKKEELTDSYLLGAPAVCASTKRSASQIPL